MTRSEVNQVLSWLDAGKLQLNHGGEWVDYKEGFDPSIWYPQDKFELYREKPTPTLRPWRPEEVPVGALFRNKAKDLYRGLILSVDDNSIYTCANASSRFYQHSFEDALRLREHSLDHGKTWLPCGVVAE